MRNTTERFGWASRLIHWVMAAGLIFMLGLGVYIDNMTVSLGNLWLYGLHKSIGITLLALVLLRGLWHRLSPPPVPLGDGVPGWQESAARWSHRGLYALMLLIPLTGWIGSGATGIPVMLFDTVTLPPLAPVSEVWEEVAFEIHSALTKALFALLALHIAGALHHHLILRDRTLVRMLRG